MDVRERLSQLIDERGWSKYQLAKKSGLSESTLANTLRRNSIPSIPTLEAVCDGLGITLAQFFAEGDMVELTPELKELFEGWRNLTVEQKQATLQMVRSMSNH